MHASRSAWISYVALTQRVLLPAWKNFIIVRLRYRRCSVVNQKKKRKKELLDKSKFYKLRNYGVGSFLFSRKKGRRINTIRCKSEIQRSNSYLPSFRMIACKIHAFVVLFLLPPFRRSMPFKNLTQYFYWILTWLTANSHIQIRISSSCEKKQEYIHSLIEGSSIKRFLLLWKEESNSTFRKRALRNIE